MRRTHTLAALVLLLADLGHATAAPKSPFDGKTAVRHQTNFVEGWTVLVDERLLAGQPAATQKALELLRGQLKEIVGVVPAPAVAKLQEVTLWFSPEYPGVQPRAEYHPGAGWLRDHGRDPAMVKSVEFTDVRIFEAESRRMPNFTLHELAHAYHDRVLTDGFENAEIKAAFERAQASQSYDKVERWFGNGRSNTFERAYAMTNPQEYFAESTEAYFSRNDFFPFTRDELKRHDPEMAQLLGRLWAGASSSGTGAAARERTLPPYRQMDFGPALFWTYEIAPGNIAQKGIAIRLDDGPGGVSKGRAWMVYDHDTMRVAAATTGDFVDWKGIAFDGSHGTHTSLIGERHFVDPVGPGWASPGGTWEDPRLVGRDHKRYGPLPREWAHYEGLYLHGAKAVIAANIGGTRVLESPGWTESGSAPVFTRTLNVGVATQPLLLRVAPDRVSAALAGDGLLRKEDGFWVAELPGGAKTRLFVSRAEEASLAAIAKAHTGPLELEPLTHGGPPRWAQEVITTSVPGAAGGAFIADTLPLPTENPWHSWMRPGGFDFTPDGKGAIVATWNGDVWRVDGLTAAAPATLRWRRIASGLFQPLGVKFRGAELFILCRDQLVRLTDLNGDGEADLIENFNNDHQVTEHFHEFAMGLQIDDAGNFYYAKSGRHALDSVVPHHGTLLRVSADGGRTDILATGFRAANGVCLNDDGTFFVTDQEGFWTPKNRINRVKVGGFYGNMFGYSSVTNTSDAAMEPPMVWITNAKDRSPAELVWVPKHAWGALGGSLLNLSYGTGRIFIVPHEEVGGQWQGAVCELPMPAFATGIMRGRFAADGALYACGLFGWAGNATAPGGFHRIRRTEKPAHLPLAIHAAKGKVRLTFSDPIDPVSAEPGAFAFKVWSLKRSADYGSKHYDEHALELTGASLSADARTVTIEIPALAPTQCYELKLRLVGKAGGLIERSLHGTIHRLSEE
jgi:glucose/arabinose dehydrogenase